VQVEWNQAAQRISLTTGTDVVPPPVSTGDEVRGAWISTVFNLDWPKTKTSAEQQKASYIALLDSLQDVGINTVYVQVRPAGDALYPSSIVPWSKVLTGIQGADPGYDPVAFMVEETHKRNMEFHAWFNPFRANTDILTASLDPSHVALSHPDWIVNTGKQLYINPGIPEARQHIIDTIMEVVNGYDIDGIHLDTIKVLIPTLRIGAGEISMHLYNRSERAYTV
jgi:uncharacterized lipoprotein YddW (UPF0748 family)